MYRVLMLVCALLSVQSTFAHPMPNSVVALSILESSIRGEAKMPLAELESATGQHMPDEPFFRDYFERHIQAVSGQDKWNTTIESIDLTTDKDPFVGKYREVIVRFTLIPPGIENWRKFTLNYDAIIHQVVTHKVIVFVTQDWRNGIHEESSAQLLGIIRMDVPAEKIFPLEVSLDKGSWWAGFSSMIRLGMRHIKEGPDHLLFLVVLLLPATLLASGRRWRQYGGARYSIKHLLKIVTAFTIGHSLTLIIGALGWLRLPAQPVEILIAISILVSAIHAVYPIFPGREMYIAMGFGLIHGLAFAGVLSNLQLRAGTLAFSILGFNLGIELMQLIIIAVVIPWLLLLSRTAVYKWVRISTAVLSAIAALIWVAERSTM